MAVVGAGVFGAWTAYQLQRAGKRVLMIDSYGAGNSRSSSGDESRIIRMGYGADEIYTRSAHRALRLWKEFFETSNEPLFYQTGVLWLVHDDDPYPVSTAETFEKLTIPFEKLDTTEIGRRYPQIGLDRISWALLEPESGVLAARRAVQAVARKAIQNGVVYLHDAVKTPNVDVAVNGNLNLDYLETASGQRVSAADYVFACGAWMPNLFPDLLADKILPTRQEVFYFGTPAGDQRFATPALPTWIDFKDEAYGLPDVDGRGLKVAIDRHGQTIDPDNDNRIVSDEGQTEARQYLARRLPDMEHAPVSESRVCQYENTSNGDFLIDRHPDFENVWLVGGGSGHGFKHGPVVGEYVAARILGNDEGIETRFSLQTKETEQKRAVY